VMLYANGIGPLNNAKNVRRSARVLDKTDIITLRDPTAKKTLEEMGVTRPESTVTADPVFGMDSADPVYGRGILAAFGVPDTAKRVLGVSVRRTRDTDAEFERAMAELCDYAAQKYGCYTVFIPMQASRDEGISRSIMSQMKMPSSIIDVRLEIDEMISAVAALDLCIGMRLHSLIYATTTGVPLIGIEYDPKIKSFMDYAGQRMCLASARLDAEAGKRLIDECFMNYDEIKRQLVGCSAELAKKATENGRIAAELYKKEV
ncbi:MAG: polysaccharide pyruvyl transferase family protein, partial [Clostridia bacterium]|nr:polysaccharide pyruvyl transferase family protein [Clostridia bacterium]